MFKVFYSWQSDLPGRTNRNLILGALERACKDLKSSDGVIAESVVDRDTLGLAGAPNIGEAILGKIRDCDAFVADVSLVSPAGVIRASNPMSRRVQDLVRLVHRDTSSQEVAARRSPNPNVLVELGYAMAQLGNEALILVVNRHYGAIEDLPFDLRSLRTLSYSAAPGDDVGEARKNLSRDLAAAIQGVGSAVRGDPVDSILYERTLQVAGQARALFMDMARATGRFHDAITENEIMAMFESLTVSECLDICKNINPNGEAPLLINTGAMQRRATWIECMKSWRKQSGAFTSQVLAFSPFLKREHAALLMRVEQSTHFMLLEHLDIRVGNQTFEWLSDELWKYFRLAAQLDQYARAHLARRSKPF